MKGLQLDTSNGVTTKGRAQLELEQQLARGERFAFGENWRQFLKHLDETRIREAEVSLQEMLQLSDLRDKTFLDVGSGSGLFSLAARRLGARVHSFDFDPSSVACATELRQRFFHGDAQWCVERGSILDEDYVRGLGAFDIVYSWGVLHHSGEMWRALDLVMLPVKTGGKLFVAIYNDQGWISNVWKAIKKTYGGLPHFAKPLLAVPVGIATWGPVSFLDLMRGKPFHTWRRYYQSRGMSPWHDVVDWVGGFPFEVATPEKIFDFYSARGFILRRLATAGGKSGNNQFVFERQG